MKTEVKNLDETKLLSEIFGDNIKDKGAFVTLLGDIGAGKTAFTRFLIKHLGVIEDVTSPSFVILNEYKSKYFPIYHFDLYRLEESGVKSIKEELREYSKENILTLVEWANFGLEELPSDRIEIKISYDINNYSTKRTFEFTSKNEKYIEIINKTTEEFEKARKA